MAAAGTVVGYFFALLVLVSALPLLFLLIRHWRRVYSANPTELFEVKLSKSAKEAMETRKFGVVQKRKSNSASKLLLHVKQSVSMMRDEITTTTDDAGQNKDPFTDLEADLLGAESAAANAVNATFSFRLALRDGHTYFGIKDLLLPKGMIHFFGKSMSLPPGLLEDFMLYACNNINPLPFLFSDKEHPTSLLSRYVVYCNSQVFSLTIYLLINKNYRIVIGFLLTPIILFCEFWLTRLIACPCLQNNNSDSVRDSATGGEKENKETCVIWGKRILRMVGGVLSLPLLLVFVCLLVVLAVGLANDTFHGRVLGRFVFDGIILPFLVKLVLVALSFCYKLHPHHVNVCGVNVFKINHWTELQFIEEDLNMHENLSAEQAKDRKDAHWKKSFGEASIFHLNCYYLRYNGLPTDSNYRIDVCHPSCYCARCCNAVSDVSNYPTRQLLPRDSHSRDTNVTVNEGGTAGDKKNTQKKSRGDDHGTASTMEVRLLEVGRGKDSEL